MSKKSYIVKYVIMAAVLLVSAAAALMLGSAEIPLCEVFSELFSGSDGASAIIIRSVRLPRLLAALLAGWGLSVSGTLLQSVTNNRLASPNIIGVNAGAGLAVILILCLFPNALVILPFGAFFGALAATLVIVGIAGKIGRSKVTVILAGMALTTVLNAGISFVLLADTDIVATYNHFSIGGLSGVSTEQLIIPVGFILLSYISSLLLSRRIDTLCLGDSLASSLGIRVKALRAVCLILASMSAAAVVSFAGLLGFVGLIVPNMTRTIAGNSICQRLVASPLIGGSLVILADMLGRVLLAPTEIPVGIVMAAVGSPFFLILLLRRKDNA